MDVFARIKRLVLAGDVAFTRKAANELRRDGLKRSEVYEAIINAPCISKTLSSHSPTERGREKLYVIKGMTFDSVAIYTKGKIQKELDKEIFYVLISSKCSEDV